MDTPFHYLGMPIGVKPSSWVVWEPLISKFKAKLSKWNHKNLSMGGKVTLIKSVLILIFIHICLVHLPFCVFSFVFRRLMILGGIDALGSFICLKILIT